MTYLNFIVFLLVVLASFKLSAQDNGQLYENPWGTKEYIDSKEELYENPWAVYKQEEVIVVEEAPKIEEVIFSFEEAKRMFGVDMSGDDLVAVDGVQTSKAMVNGIEVNVFKTESNVLTRIFKNDEGVNTVVVEDESGDFSFLQKIGKGMKKITKSLAFSKTKLDFEGIKTALVKVKGILDSSGKGTKGRIQ